MSLSLLVYALLLSIAQARVQFLVSPSTQSKTTGAAANTGQGVAIAGGDFGCQIDVSLGIADGIKSLLNISTDLLLPAIRDPARLALRNCL